MSTSSTTTTQPTTPTESITDSMLKDLLGEPQPEVPEFLRLCQEPPSGYWDAALRACNGLQECGVESEGSRVMDPQARFPGLLMAVPDRAPGLLMIKNPGQWPVAPRLPAPGGQGLLGAHRLHLQAPPPKFFRSRPSNPSNNLQSELQVMRNELQAFQHQQNQKMLDLEVRYSFSKDQELEQLRKEKEAWLQERQMLQDQNQSLLEALESEAQEKRLLEDNIQEYRYDADIDNDIRKEVEMLLEHKDAQIKDLLETLESMGKAHREELQELQDCMEAGSKEQKALEAQVENLKEALNLEILLKNGSLAKIENLKGILTAKTLDTKKSKKQFEKKISTLEKKLETANSELSDSREELLEQLNKREKMSLELGESLEKTTRYLEQLIASREENQLLKTLTTKLEEKLAEERRKED
ncbi:hypothetical protein CAEBREN_17086 [Caenorhabditis brenneri]|uniref:Uncharacterized protein n=1 Tax=Caenorhabditis brenneri TaxID=135651 RepID=G0NNW1_CAEBE|nr:hypothetical protein CAEBREN_17086 [Caenorhabditis brenneri]